MSNSRPINWYGSPLIRAIGTALLFLSLASVPIVTLPAGLPIYLVFEKAQSNLTERTSGLLRSFGSDAFVNPR